MLKNFRMRGVTTVATIIHLEERYRSKGGTYYYITFTYRTIPAGESYTGRSVEYKKHEVGQTIPLIYMPDKPEKFSVDTGKRLPYLAAFSFVFFLLITWFCYWLSNLQYTVDKV